MNYFFITGTSRGIGKALAERLLAQGSVVYGLARNNTIVHENYHHVPLDLSKKAQYNFPILEDATSITLVNNAASLGDIGYVGDLNEDNISDTLFLNLNAPILLSNAFIKQYKKQAVLKRILNISSGAATAAYDGWSIYCASKAGLELFTKCVIEEQKIENNPTEIYAIAPGVVDTEMQTTIRNTAKEQFSRIEKFQDLYNTQKLYNPNDVATILAAYLLNQKPFPETVFRIVL